MGAHPRRLGAISLVIGNHGRGDYKAFTQAELGDKLGLSTVPDWEGLKALGKFDPPYLHQIPREAA